MRPASSTSAGPRETEEVGARIAEGLGPGDLVLVSGELGAGKTTLIRGACRALGVTEPVTSPTFTIGHRYRGRTSVSHLDFYRLAGGGPRTGPPALDEEPGLLDDYLDPGAIVFAEWPDAAGPLLEAARSRGGRVIRVLIRHAGQDRRKITIEYDAGHR